jgi:hypothetical protein
MFCSSRLWASSARCLASCLRSSATRAASSYSAYSSRWRRVASRWRYSRLRCFACLCSSFILAINSSRYSLFSVCPSTVVGSDRRVELKRGAGAGLGASSIPISSFALCNRISNSYLRCNASCSFFFYKFSSIFDGLVPLVIPSIRSSKSR